MAEKDNNNITLVNNSDYNVLLQNIGEELERGRQRIVTAVNAAIIEAYWRIGQYIVEYEQNGNEKAEYGSDILTIPAESVEAYKATEQWKGIFGK